MSTKDEFPALFQSGLTLTLVLVKVQDLHLQITASSLVWHVCKILENSWDNVCCGVHFYWSSYYQVLYQISIHAVLIMSVLRKKGEFYKGESDREVIVIAAGVLGRVLLQQAGFPIMRALPSHQIFSPPHESLSSPIVTWNGTQNDLILKGTFFLPVARIFMRICNSKIFNPLPSTEFLGECHQPTEKTLMENPGGSRKEPCLSFRRQNTVFLLFNVFKAIKWVTMALKTIFMA